MKTRIALFRGINIVGRNALSMTDLKAVLEKRGCTDVHTYIQSGNVIFRSPTSSDARLAEDLTAAISKSHGFEPRVLILSRSELERAADGNPFPKAKENPQTLHLFFLAELPKKPDLKALESLKAGREAFALTNRIFYLYTPDGFGRSKLAARAERLLGVEATARNWRTVTTLLAMAKTFR
jgi:uncharacterized protein (DUF1697 family)